MGQVVKFNFPSISRNENIVFKHKDYEEKLIRIRDEIEDYLCQVSINESDEIAVELAAGRYATMKLTQLSGEKDTKSFVDDCIKTTLHN